MKLPLPLLGFALTLAFSLVGLAGDSPSNGLSIGLSAGRPEIRFARPPVAPLGGTRYRLMLEASSDFQTWSQEGELIPDSGSAMHFVVPGVAPHRFFRVQPRIEDFGGTPDGAELFGYDRIFQEELSKVGFLTPEEFAARHKPSSDYLSALTFDPTTARFWDAFNSDPAVVNATLPANSPDRRLYDFRLNSDELAVFKKYGFVVSERVGSSTFADVFYRIFTDEFPVFVSADAILHAWHFSYQRLLEETEETQLMVALQEILNGMNARLAELPETVRSGPLRDSVRDADYFLAVARSLLMGLPQPTVLGGDEQVKQTLDLIAKLEYVPDPPGFELFGRTRPYDFSQFKVRGHYERSIGLGRYFQAFMWTARVDFQILAPQFDGKADAQSLRELGTAVALTHLLRASGQTDKWRQLDDLIRLFVGRTDAMTFAQLEPLLDASGLKSLDSVTSLEQLAKLQQDIFQGTLGLQSIPSDVYYSPFGPEQVQLPRAFVVTGQRFNPDGWSLAQVTFDRIKWNQEIPGTVFGKVLRRYPSALDVAYSVLGNRQIGWEIAQRMLDKNGMIFRDGLPYAHNLTALAATFDRMSTSGWQDSIYTRWLAALRELSAPTTDPRFPEAMRTRAWVMRTLNSQLASYTELKHDTVLYAKQPYTSIFLCDYPAGFVEPVPTFWQKMQELAEALAAGLEKLPASGVVIATPPPDPWNPFSQGMPVDLAQRKIARVNFCRNFAQQMSILAALAAKELQQQPFTDAETAFIRGLMNRQDHAYYGPTFDGWYPGLFYKDYGQLGGSGDSNGSNKPDPLVTDVHTAPPDEVDPRGGVLHEATGNVDLLLIAVDNGPDRMVYAGPVMSYYEFMVPGPTLQRLTDSEWQGRLFTTPRPARPEWTRSYLVPQ